MRERVATLARMADLLITRARIVEQQPSPGAPEPTDVRVTDGAVTEITPGGALAPSPGERVLEADGAVLPGAALAVAGLAAPLLDPEQGLLLSLTRESAAGASR